MTTRIIQRHLLVAAKVRRKPTAEESAQWMANLVAALELKALTDPIISYSSTPGNTGYLGLLGLTTSHMSFHHWDCFDVPVLQFDLYTCSVFSPSNAMHHIDRFWDIISAKSLVINRGEGDSIDLVCTPVEWSK